MACHMYFIYKPLMFAINYNNLSLGDLFQFVPVSAGFYKEPTRGWNKAAV